MTRSAFASLLLLASLALPVAPLAQNAPLTWGDVPREHLEMVSFPADTNAAAVILADYGVSEIVFHRNIETTLLRHRRVKILKESGYDWGTVVLSYYAKDRAEEISRIRGQTFTLDANGQVQRHELDKQSIYTEDAPGGVKRIRFTLPALAPGAVIEYSYEVAARSIRRLPPWQFQLSEPVLHSEYRTKYLDAFRFVQASKGTLGQLEVETTPYAGPGTMDGTLHRYVMRDVPALREEPFMTTADDYRASIEFQLAGFYSFETGDMTFMQNWPELAEELHATSLFEQQFDPSRSVRRHAESLVAGLTDPAEKLIALYDHVRREYTFNGGRGFIPDQKLDDVLEKRTGSVADLTGLLVALARAAGLEAYPVLASTRSNGRVQTIYPLLSQFDDALAYIGVTDAEGYLLKPTNPLRPHTLLPLESLGGEGWLVRDKRSDVPAQWVSLQATARYAHAVAVTATLGPDGTLTGQVRVKDDQYAALDTRSHLDEAAADLEVVRDVMLADLAGARIDSFRIAGREATAEGVTTEAAFLLPAYAQAVGDFIYLNPTVLDRQTENPLKLAERTFPVDMAMPVDRVYSLALKVPEGYVVQEMPEPVQVRLSDGGLFLQQVETMGDQLLVQARFVLSKPVFGPDQYAELRELYARVVAAHAQQVVLQRTPPKGGEGR